MKKIILAVTLLTLAFSFSTAQKTAPIKKVQVTPATIASQPAGKALVLNLTGTGTIYALAAGIDYSRVRVRTSTGEMAMSDLARKLGMTGSKFLLGRASDLSTQNFGFPPGGGTFQPPGGDTSPAKCHPDQAGVPSCYCFSRRDCRDMDRAGLCYGDRNIWACGKPTSGEEAGKNLCVCSKKD